MATLGLHTFDQGCNVRCDSSQPKVLVDTSLLRVFVFIVTRALKAVSDRYVVLNMRITLVIACLASLGATAMTFQNFLYAFSL